MGKIKCPECLGCMDYVWVDKNRYLNCAFCRTWYAGMVGELRQVENPYLVECPYCRLREIDCEFCNNIKKIDRRRLENVVHDGNSV